MIEVKNHFSPDIKLQNVMEEYKAPVMSLKEAELRKVLVSFFETDWYLSQNPDVAKNGMDPVLHYLRHGAAEGRRPREDFCGNAYLAANPDVADEGLNPLLHWVLFGRKERRRCSVGDEGIGISPDFDESLPIAFRSIDRLEEDQRSEMGVDVSFRKLAIDSGVFRLKIAPVDFPIVLYAAQRASVPALRIRQALALTTGRVFVLDCVIDELGCKDSRISPLPSGGEPSLKRFLSAIISLGVERVGFWEVSLAPAMGAWSMLSATLDDNPHLSYVGASILRPAGQIWRSGFTFAKGAGDLRPQGKGAHFFDPWQFRLKPSAAIDPLFGLIRTESLSSGLTEALSTQKGSTTDILANLSSILNGQKKGLRGGKVTSPWATQGCAIVISDAVPSVTPRFRPANFTEMGRGVQEGIVFVDSIPPRPDQDAGSVTAINFLEILLTRKSELFFFSTTLRSWNDPYTLALSAKGVICLTDRQIPDYNAACDLIQAAGHSQLTFFLTRVHAGGEYVEITRARFPRARLIFNTVDLHGLREMREADITKNGSSIFCARATNARERDIIQRCDATILLSEAEVAELTPTLGYANLHLIPLVAEFSYPKKSFIQRSGLLFIGGFSHRPNVDAVEYIIDELWALIRCQAPSMNLTIVGSHFPDRLRSRLPEGVEAVGFVKDLRGELEKVRATIAPLRYGAGIKGKVVTSMSHGVPCVATTMAAEGLGMADGTEIMIADDPQAFADAVVQLHEDSELWNKMSHAGYVFCEARFSKDVVASKLNSLLDELV